MYEIPRFCFFLIRNLLVLRLLRVKILRLQPLMVQFNFPWALHNSSEIWGSQPFYCWSNMEWKRFASICMSCCLSKLERQRTYTVKQYFLKLRMAILDVCSEQRVCALQACWNDLPYRFNSLKVIQMIMLKLPETRLKHQLHLKPGLKLPNVKALSNSIFHTQQQVFLSLTQ